MEPEAHARGTKRIAGMMDPKTWPFDEKRMIYGGFSLLEEV